MGRSQAMEAQKRREQQQGINWSDLSARIRKGLIIPIVGNGVFNDLLFPQPEEKLRELESGRENLLGWSVEEFLSHKWAESIHYPLPESHVLSRVALFDRVVNSYDDMQAKGRYFDWLKEFLIKQAESDKSNDLDRVAELKDEMGVSTLSYLAAELGYPRLADGATNPLDFLAKLNLPIYLTTSPYDLLERAILANDRQPRTQICFWRGTEPLRWEDETHKPDNNFYPNVDQPLVYHIFGHELYPESIVLSEDDHLDFLSALAKDHNATQPILPPRLRAFITQSSLILLGYRLRDADFRVLFRGLINSTPDAKRPYSLAIQVDPRARGAIVSTEALINYITTYMSESKFTIAWQSPAEFVETMWEEFNQWRR